MGAVGHLMFKRPNTIMNEKLIEKNVLMFKAFTQLSGVHAYIMCIIILKEQGSHSYKLYYKSGAARGITALSRTNQLNRPDSMGSSLVNCSLFVNKQRPPRVVYL